MRRIIAFMALTWLMPAILTATTEIDLTTVPDHLPYEATPEWNFGARQTQSFLHGRAIIPFDINNDGEDDFIYTSVEYISARAHRSLGHITYYQVNLPPKYVRTDIPVVSPAVENVGDLTGDGREDMVVVGQSRDNTEWWLWILDCRSGLVHLKSTLPIGTDVRPDGWDGIYYPVGSINVTKDGRDVRAVVLGCTVGFDKYGRGVLAIDPADGSILWRYETGPNPFYGNTRIGDLDNDGQAEIIMVGRSPDNLAGETINGFSDAETRLFVIDRQGKLRWSRFMSKSYGNGDLVLGDMDGDGRPEIVTSAQTTPEIWGEIVVWDAQGDALARYSAASQMHQVNLINRRDSAIPAILAVSGTTMLWQFALRDGALELTHEATLPSVCRLNLVGDFLPRPGVEIVASHRGQTLVLDEDFAPLLAMEHHGLSWGSPADTWHPDDDRIILYWPVKAAAAMALSKAPFAWGRLLPFGVAVVLIAVSSFAVWLWRRPRKVDGRLLHETRLNLLENLDVSSHGAIAPLKSVRRLVWHLRALQTDLVDTSKVEIRLRETWSECKDVALPHLRGIIDRAQLAGLGAGEMGLLSKALCSIEKQLTDLAHADFKVDSRDETVEALEESERQADAALLRLRAEVAVHFKTDVERIAKRVQSARSLDLSTAGVRFQMGYVCDSEVEETGPSKAPAEIHALCDARELEFILDNLVGNAIAATSHTSIKNISLRWRTGDGMVFMDVSDTGCGLAPDLWDRALNSRYSCKASGGLGLPKSVRYLRKYGGGLSIMSSEPGQGSTFRVALPLL